MKQSDSGELPFLSNVGLMLTYRCNIACAHCIVKAGPHRREEFDVAKARHWLDELRAYRNGRVLGISLTGGEPFYNQKLLASVASHAGKLGFIVSVVTNAFWASSKEEALKTLERYESIKMTSFSTDASHQEKIPLSNIRNAIWAAKKIGKLYNVAISTESENDPSYKALVDELLDTTEPENVQTSIIAPVGRAEEEIDTRKFSYSTEPAKTACSMASFPVIFPNGNVIGCVGPPIISDDSNPLFLGNLNEESISSIFDRAEGNFILHAIRTFGPKTLVEQLKANGGGHLVPNRYIEGCICDVCYRLLSSRARSDELRKCAHSPDFRKKVAYGRYYYLHESDMVERLEEFDETNPTLSNVLDKNISLELPILSAN